MVLMCIGSIELIWVAKYGKMEQKYPFWAFSGDMYGYILGSDRFWPTCTGTCQTCTGTPCFVFPISTSFRNLAITCSFIILFE